MFRRNGKSYRKELYLYLSRYGIDPWERVSVTGYTSVGTCPVTGREAHLYEIELKSGMKVQLSIDALLSYPAVDHLDLYMVTLGNYNVAKGA